MTTDPQQTQLEPEEQLILIAHRLRKIREAKGWTQAKLARKIGTHVNTIAEYENQNRPPTLLKLLRVCHALGVTMAELLDETI